VRGHVRTRSHWRMDLPSRQSLQISSRSPSSVRLAAISTRSHRTVLRGRDETVAGAGGVTVSTIPASRRRAGASSLARLTHRRRGRGPAGCSGLPPTGSQSQRSDPKRSPFQQGLAGRRITSRNPITGIAACCARAASGHAAAAPPSSDMNSRRLIFGLIRSPRRRGRVSTAEFRGRAPWRPLG